MKKTSFLCFYFVVVFKVELIWFSFIVIVALGSRARLERAPAAVSSCAREPARQLLVCPAVLRLLSSPLTAAVRRCGYSLLSRSSCSFLLAETAPAPLSVLQLLRPSLESSSGSPSVPPSPASRGTCTGFCTSGISGLKFPEPVLWGPAWVGVSRFCCHSSALSSLRESRTDRTSKVREPNQPAADAVTETE